MAGDDEVLVRIHATSVNPADWHLLRGDPRIARLQMGLRAPKHTVLGSDVAGTVEAVGRNVSSFQPGDEVFGNSFARGFGAFAERAAVPEDLLVEKPAQPVVRAGGGRASRRADGAAGPARSRAGRARAAGARHRSVRRRRHLAVQLARLLGAEVTGVCSERNVDLVRSLGAHDVIDYTRDDFTEGARRFDVIFQLAGTASPSELRRILSRKGTLVLSSGESDGHWVGPLGRVLKAVALSPFVSQRLVSFTMTPGRDDLRFLKERLEAGELEPVIDRTYPLAELPEAIRYLEQGRARGKVIVTVTGV